MIFLVDFNVFALLRFVFLNVIFKYITGILLMQICSHKIIYYNIIYYHILVTFTNQILMILIWLLFLFIGVVNDTVFIVDN